MSFIILEKSKFPDINAFRPKLQITPETTLYTVEINILGLRDLEPLSIIPVKKPYIIFDVNGLNFPSPGEKSDKMLISLKTQPKEGGANPNINTVMKFEVSLPKKDIFIPELQCMVNDYMLSGLINPLLGVFLIPIKDVIHHHGDIFNRDFVLLEKNYAKFTDPNYKEPEEKIILEEDIILKDKTSSNNMEKDKDDKISVIKDINLKEALIPSNEKKTIKEGDIPQDNTIKLPINDIENKDKNNNQEKLSKNCIIIISFFLFMIFYPFN